MSPDPATQDQVTADPFAGIAGQEQAVVLMRHAAAHPVHAYLVTGPQGAELIDAARAFAAALVAPDGDPRTIDLVRRGSHPDVVEFEPEGTNLSIRQVREEIIPEAWRSPIEAPRKVLLLLEAEAMCRGGMEAANALLKTFEEPPTTTVTVLVTSSPDELLATVRSRCQRIDLAPLDEATVIEALVAEGHDAQSAAWAARAAGVQLGRARELLGDRRSLRDAFVDAVGELDGSGAAAARVAGRIDAVIKDAIMLVRNRHEEELAEFDAAAERAGYPPRAVATQRRRMATRHERHERIARRDALVEGITALETVYRDALAGTGAPRRNLDREPLTIDARACVRALEACRSARQSLERNPNEGLLLERLALHLTGGRPVLTR